MGRKKKYRKERINTIRCFSCKQGLIIVSSQSITYSTCLATLHNQRVYLETRTTPDEQIEEHTLYCSLCEMSESFETLFKLERFLKDGVAGKIKFMKKIPDGARKLITKPS